MSKFGSLSTAIFKGFIRDRVTLFFNILFPLMFLVVFGLIFGNAGTSKVTIGVSGDGPVIAALNAAGDAVSVQHFDNADDGVAKVRSGDVPAVVIEQGGQVQLRYAASDQTQAGIVRGLVGGIVDQVNLAATGRPPALNLTADQVEDTSLRPIQYLTPGLLSWSIASSGVFGAALTLVSWRQRQVLRRIRLAPVSTPTVLGARVVVSVGVALIQTAVFIGVATLPVFGLKLTGQWYLALPLLVLGVFSFFSIGLLAGSFAKTEEAATGLANFIVLPMAFLSGSFFNIDAAPAWLRGVSEIFPLRHLNDGMLAVLGRGQGIHALLVPGAVLIAFTLVIGSIAALLFRWDDA